MTTRDPSGTVLPYSESLGPFYHTKEIEFFGRPTRILLQNENGPCPLLSLCNILLLRNQLKLPLRLLPATCSSDLSETCHVVLSSSLLNALGDALIESNAKNLINPETAQFFGVNIEEVITNIVPRLNEGLDVNCRFDGPNSFEYTPELDVFDLLGVRLFHGWLLPDPSSPSYPVYRQQYRHLKQSQQDMLLQLAASHCCSDSHESEEAMYDNAMHHVICNKSYNQLVERCIACREQLQGMAAKKPEDSKHEKNQEGSTGKETNVVSISGSEEKAGNPTECVVEQTSCSDNNQPYSGHRHVEPHDDRIKSPSDSGQRVKQTEHQHEVVDLLTGSDHSLNCAETAVAIIHDGAASLSSVDGPQLEIRSEERPALGDVTESVDRAAAAVGRLALGDDTESVDMAGAGVERPALGVDTESVDRAAAAVERRALGDDPESVDRAAAAVERPALGDDPESVDRAAAAVGRLALGDDTESVDMAGAGVERPALGVDTESVDKAAAAVERLALGDDPVSVDRAAAAVDRPALGDDSESVDSAAAESLMHASAVRDGLVIQEFLDSTSSQLTEWGLAEVSLLMKERELAVFFRNNHFNTMFKLDGSLYLLATDVGFGSMGEAIWEHLERVDGNNRYCNNVFKSPNGETRRGNEAGSCRRPSSEPCSARNPRPSSRDVVPQRKVRSTTAGRSGDESTEEQRDFELAMSLQKQEEEQWVEDGRSSGRPRGSGRLASDETPQQVSYVFEDFLNPCGE
eukprot:GHVS01058533.1.p2 GENE.GHVS01058533.1~~GHVS01058533.1.p2  ORF type:complete len:746 (-),score=95.53 GHVS01058533.1:2960-5197(-)